MKHNRLTATIAMFSSIAILGSLAACGSGSSSGSKEIKVAYTTSGNATLINNWYKNAKARFEKANPGATMVLEPIQVGGDDYNNKLTLMNKSSDTAPDVMTVDSTYLQPFAEAGYLQPLDSYVTGWKDWNQYYDTIKQAGKGTDGKTYGIFTGTDTRGIWYNKDVFKTIGITGNWQPKSWDEMLDVARKIKKTDPNVIPLNVYASKSAGEVTVAQGFDQLLYGTANGTLYNKKTNKWVVGSRQFKSALNFIKTVYSQNLGPSAQQALDPQEGHNLYADWMPNGKIGMAMEGSWFISPYVKGGDAEWANWQKHVGWAAMPTQNGQKPGVATMSGGWILAISKRSKNPGLAWKAIEALQTKQSAINYYVLASQLSVRKDAVTDKTYLGTNPSIKFFSNLVQYAHFRPLTSDYTQISAQIGIACESVMTGQQSVNAAAKTYDTAITGIVGESNTTTVD